MKIIMKGKETPAPETLSYTALLPLLCVCVCVCPLSVKTQSSSHYKNTMTRCDARSIPVRVCVNRQQNK